MSSLFDLSGRTALVTGSSRGIGLTLAGGLSRAGARVVLHGRDQATLDSAREALTTATSPEIHTARFDITDPEAVDAGITAIERDFGPIQILVNNAGIQRRGAFAEFPLSDWNDLIATNLSSAFFVGQRVSREMTKRGEGKVVNIGSVQSLLGRPSIAAYAATKGGIAMLTKGMCADLASHGIQVNALAPGYFSTELTKTLVADEAFSEWVRGRTPAGRWGETEDLVGALVFLTSRASDFVNGQVLYVDGGMTAVV